MAVPLLVSDMYDILLQRVQETGNLGLDLVEEINRSVGEIKPDVQEIIQATNSLLSAFSSESTNMGLAIERFDSDLNTMRSSLHRNPAGGMLTLPLQEYVDKTGSIQAIRILSTLSRGIPGNNMVVANIVASRDSRPEVSLVGGANNFANIAGLFDGREDTHFEWELNVVQRRQRVVQKEGLHYLSTDRQGQDEKDVWEITRGYGWKVDVYHPEKTEPEEVDLAILADSPPADPATLFLEIEMSDNSVGYIDILPLSVGGTFPVLVALDLSKDGVNWQSALKPRADMPGATIPLREGASLVRLLRIPLEGNRYVRLGLRSGGWYSPRFGLAHPFAAAIIDEQFRQKLLGFTIKSDRRVLIERTPTEKTGVGSIVVQTNTGAELAGRVLGTAYAVSSGLSMKWLTQALSKEAVAWLGTAAPVVGAVLAFALIGGFVFSERKERSVREVVTGYDVFRGWRSAIALKEIRVVRESYRQDGEWMSRPMSLGQQCRAVRLRADYDKPNGTRIEYFVSTDGKDWKAISPISDGGTPVDLPSPFDSVYLQVKMQSADPQVTPRLYALAVEGIPA